MNLFLLALGVAAAAGGCVMVGFGIPINAFSLGNTLIISGTVALSSGFILMGLAAALGQLRRIAEALNARPLSAASRAPESVEARVPPTARITPAPPPPSPVPTRAPMPPRPMDMPEAFSPEPRPAPQRLPEPPRQPEPRFPAAPVSEPPGPLDWLRAKTRPGAPTPIGPPVAEPPMVEMQDEAPLSPRPPQRPPIDPAFESKPWSPPGRADSLPEPRPMPRAMPQPEAPKEPEVPQFDAVWDRSAPALAEGKREARADTPPPAAPRRDDMPVERRADSVATKSPPERTPTILKSGVIDGMPYTLYADGSIEAQLPQGTVKFGSVDALRAHLEQQG